MGHRGRFQFERGALAGWFTLALLAGCSADAPEAPPDLDSVSSSERDGGLPSGGLHLVGGGIGGAPDLARPAPSVPGPDMAQVSYPAGPYGNQPGDTLADLPFAGFRL